MDYMVFVGSYRDPLAGHFCFRLGFTEPPVPCPSPAVVLLCAVSGLGLRSTGLGFGGLGV